LFPEGQFSPISRANWLC